MLGILREVWSDRVTWDKGMKSQIIDNYIRFWLANSERRLLHYELRKLLFILPIPGGIGSTLCKWTFLRDDKWHMESRLDQIFYMGQVQLQAISSTGVHVEVRLNHVEPTAKTNLESTSVVLKVNGIDILCVCCLPEFGISVLTCSAMDTCVSHGNKSHTPIPMMDTQMTTSYIWKKWYIA